LHFDILLHFLHTFKMFQSNAFIYTRGVDSNSNMNHDYYLQQYETSDIHEDLNIDNYNRDRLRDRGPDKTIMAHEEVRRDKFSKWQLNLRHHGAFDPTEPYMNSDIDLQFHDKDVRGHLQEYDWQKYRAIGTPKLKQTSFHVDHDYSLPTGGSQRNEDIMNKINNIRQELKGRLNWYSESLGILNSQTPNTFNTPAFSELEQVDPTANGMATRQTPNRIFSNMANLGGKYFKNRNTTDHVIPVSSYTHIFKTYDVQSPKSMSQMIRGDQKISSLNINEVPRNFLDFLHQRTIHDGDTRMKDSGQNRNYTATLNEILPLIGLTQNEIRHIQQLATTNTSVSDPTLKCVAELVEGIESLPPNRRLDIRNTLLSGICPEFTGTRNGVINPVVKNIIRARNITAPKSEIGERLDGEVVLKSNSKKTSNSAPGVKFTTNNGLQDHEVKINDLIKSGRFMTTRGVQDIGKRTPGVVNIHHYDFAAIGNKSHIQNYTKVTPNMDIDTVQSKTATLKNLMSNFKRVETAQDMGYGREHVFNYNLSSWNDSLHNLRR
jgi:hypothetical protein